MPSGRFELPTPEFVVRCTVRCATRALCASEVRPVRRVLSTGELTLPDGRPSISPDRRRPGLASNPRVSARAGHTLCGLAPGEVYQAGPSPGSLVGSYPTVSPLPQPRGHAAGGPKAVRRYSRRPRGVRGGLFSVALARGFPRVAVSNHPALWSPDVPRHQLVARSPGRPSRVPPPRIELGASSLSARCSNRLSYDGMVHHVSP